nr:peptidase M15 [Desulfobacula sp.]
MERRCFLKQAALALTLAAFPFTETHGEAPASDPSGSVDNHIKDRLIKQRLFDTVFEDDIFLDEALLPQLDSSLARLQKVQALVGYSNFCLLDFDEALKAAKAYAAIGEFSKPELDFLEMIFYSQGETYGFMGEKPIKTITGKISKNKVEKIPFTGNYLYQGRPAELYQEIRRQVGNGVILTSGVRSVMKQFLLFLSKAKAGRGNLSLASRSLAPPGYSFHGIGDFDVGQQGYGTRNFTEAFTQTPVYKKLIDLGYLKFRYERDNNLGVRFEPWHIEVA